MNLKDVKQPFEVDEFVSNYEEPYKLRYEVIYTTGDDNWYDLFEDPNQETCKLVVALLNMYCFNKIDLNILDLEQLNMISFLISQINKL